MRNILDTARYLAEKLANLRISKDDPLLFEMLNEGRDLPIIAFKLKKAKDKDKRYTLRDLSYKIREKGWIVPGYSLPKNAEDVEIMRVVVRENFTHDMADILVEDIRNGCEFLDKGGYRPKKKTMLETAGEEYHIC